MDKNAKHIRSNACGVALSLLAAALLVVVAVTGDDGLSVAHAGILVIAMLGASWFTCGLLTAARHRR